jgi:hypothetical protein
LQERLPSTWVGQAKPFLSHLQEVPVASELNSPNMLALHASETVNKRTLF